MKSEDISLIRVFYQELARQGFTTPQLELYVALKGTKQARLDWINKYSASLAIPLNVRLLLSSEFSKEDLAVMLAAQVVPFIVPKAQQLITKILSWLKFW